MGSKGKTSGGVAAQVGANIESQRIRDAEAARQPRPVQGVAAKTNYMAPDPWRKRGPMDQLSTQSINGGKTLLG